MFNDFTNRGCKSLCEEVISELKELGLKHGLKFTISGGSIGLSDLTIKLKASSVDTIASSEAAKKELNVMGMGFGVDASHYGMKFNSNGQMFEFVGIKPSRPKYPVIATCCSTGKAYKFTAGILDQIRN